MGFNKYNLQIVVRVTLIFITLFAAVFFIPRPNRVVTSIFFVLLAISQVVFLIRFLNSINRDLARFLIELKEKDSSEIHVPEKLERNFKDFKHSFQQISDEIQKNRIEKVSQEHYLKYIIDNINDGLITFDDDGIIQIINSSAKKLLGISFLHSIWDLDKIQEGIAKKLVLAIPGSSTTVQANIGNTRHEFIFRVSEIKIENRNLKIVTFQDLKKEFDSKEVGAWKKLMRVLTHEMMNSLTPITTLTAAIRRMLKGNKPGNVIENIEHDDLNDIYKNNETIERRSKGLLDFINQFRQLWRIPELNKEEVEIEAFLNNIRQLFSEELKKEDINLTIETDSENLSVSFDKKLIEQVMINLVKNAIEALGNVTKKEILIAAKQTEEKVMISVQDNGNGINDEVKDEIFVPFFTTKEQGSGIGLSLSKEIMQKHNGDIYFESKTDEGAIFYLIF